MGRSHEADREEIDVGAGKLMTIQVSILPYHAQIMKEHSSSSFYITLHEQHSLVVEPNEIQGQKTTLG